MKTKLYVVTFSIGSSLVRVGNFCGQDAAEVWVKIASQYASVRFLIQAGSDSNCAPDAALSLLRS